MSTSLKISVCAKCEHSEGFTLTDEVRCLAKGCGACGNLIRLNGPNSESCPIGKFRQSDFVPRWSRWPSRAGRIAWITDCDPGELGVPSCVDLIWKGKIALAPASASYILVTRDNYDGKALWKSRRIISDLVGSGALQFSSISMAKYEMILHDAKLEDVTSEASRMYPPYAGKIHWVRIPDLVMSWINAICPATQSIVLAAEGLDEGFVREAMSFDRIAFCGEAALENMCARGDAMAGARSLMHPDRSPENTAIRLKELLAPRPA